MSCPALRALACGASEISASCASISSHQYLLSLKHDVAGAAEHVIPGKILTDLVGYFKLC